MGVIAWVLVFRQSFENCSIKSFNMSNFRSLGTNPIIRHDLSVETEKKKKEEKIGKKSFTNQRKNDMIIPSNSGTGGNFNDPSLKSALIFTGTPMDNV